MVVVVYDEEAGEMTVVPIQARNKRWNAEFQQDRTSQGVA